MKKIALLMAAMLVSMMALAQTPSSDLRNDGYLFEQFSYAKVRFTDGREFTEKINYHTGLELVHFVSANGETMSLTNPQDIEFIAVGERAFFMKGNKMIERVSRNPEVYVNYKSNMRPKAQQAGYGGTTETSSVKTLGRVYENGSAVDLSSSMMVYSAQSPEYNIRVKGSLKGFKDLKGFVKLLPKEQRKDAQIKYENLDFKNVEAVLEACRENFAK